MPNLPNLIVAGAMKCGTTSLHAYLDLHPDVAMSRPKELNFFAGCNQGRGLDWYSSYFDSLTRVRGESSQNYTKRHHPKFNLAAQRMFQVVPKAKIVYLVRDPIDRYISHMKFNNYNEIDDFDRGRILKWHYIKTGMYYFQLLELLRFFDERNLLVVDLDEMFASRCATMNRVFAFLGLDPLPADDRFRFEVNRGSELRIPRGFRANPIVRSAGAVAPEMTERALRWIARRRGAEALTRGEADQLREIYARDVAQLRALTGQRFAGWSL
ncbi:sulfotransferase domain-containing protein [Acuticoccus sp. M5D2P5]|uniref:sulfotransferase domain-containing protein n=1 Tax=Acuticoccus kalidii TaxID=2910977 RepID=UPI001F3EB740|nr:sulfotransferase domain-containing protein [Acuticoccus kalidii]